ncbi:MAG TPA: hypothetical protein VEY11_04675 [Pyrinomonadaceae bacterium]|nr:hypothetical protein [Pyrinomonadaceae bacterium]
MNDMTFRTSGTRARVKRNCLLLAACCCLALLGAPASGRAQERPQSSPAAKRMLLSSPASPARRRPARRRRGGRSAGAVSRLKAASGLLLNQSLSTSALTNVERADAEKTYEDPKMRLNWFLFQRTFPADTLPSKGRFNAFSQVSLLPSSQSSPQPAPPTERWRHVGPSPIKPKFSSMGVTSGRVSAIAISPADPQVVLVGGATGGVWRSTDGGDTFVPVSDNQVDLAVGSLAFAPSNPSIAYAGMGDTAGGYMGTGVLKSLDGGQNWFRISDHTLPAPGTISDIVVDRADPERLYLTQYAYRAATGQGEVYASGFFFSEDGGKSWTKTFTGLPRDLVAHPTEPQTLYLSMSNTFSETAPSAGVYKSTDGGENWNVVFTPAFLVATEAKIAVTPAEPQTIYVFAGLVLENSAQVSVHVSRDGGDTWADLGHGEVDIGQIGYNSYISVDPTDGRKVYIGTRDLYKSTDGGVTWANLTRNWKKFATKYEFSPGEASTHTDQHVLAFSPANPNLIYIGNDGGVSRSRDGGESFESLNATLGITQFNGITLHPSDANTSCGGTQDNGVLVRSPGLPQWSEFESGDSGRCLMNPQDPGMIYSSYVYGQVFRFRNNGGVLDGGITTIATEATFREPKPEDGARIGFYPAFAINPSNGHLFFGTWRLFVSKNQGNLWTTTAGLKDLTQGETSFGRDVLTAIGIAPVGSNVIYTGSAQGRAMWSKNAGKTWKDVTKGLPRRFITSIVVSPSDPARAYVTVSGFGSGHVFRTTDSGAKWDDISQKLPNIPVNALLIDPLNAETLYAGTDIGIFRSMDDGATWLRFSNGLPPAIVTGFSAQPGGTIQASTYGRGIYQLER